MRKVAVDSTSLWKAYQSFCPALGRRVEDYFTPALLAGVNDLTSAEIAQRLCDEPGSLGVDAFDLRRGGRELVLFRSVWTSNHLALRDSLTAFASKGLARFVDALLADITRLEGWEQRLREASYRSGGSVARVTYQLTFLGDATAAEESEILTRLIADLHQARDILTKLGPSTRLQVVFHGSSVRTRPRVIRARDAATFTISGTRWLARCSAEGSAEMHLGMISLGALVEMSRSLGMDFLNENVRAGLGDRRSLANRSLRSLFRRALTNTSAGEALSSRFPFDHNGVILAVKELRIDPSADTSVLVEPRLLNGAQSVTTLVDVLTRLETQHPQRLNLEWLQKTEVVCKIIRTDERRFIADVTCRANQQNPVEPWDLRANDDIQLAIADQLRTGLGVYYERQRGSFKGHGKQGLADRGYAERTAPIEMKRLAKAILATRGRIDLIRRPREVFARDDLYRGTFTEDLLAMDPRVLLLAYKLERGLEPMVEGAIRGRVRDLGILRWARNAMWGVGLACIMNSSEAEGWLDRHGVRLRGSSELGRELGRTMHRTVPKALLGVLRHSHFRAILRAWHLGESDARAIDSQRLYSTALEHLRWAPAFELAPRLSDTATKVSGALVLRRT